MRESDTFSYSCRNDEIETEVRPYYVPERSLPSHNVYFYAYSVTITNHGEEPCRLMRRSWLINSGDGKKENIEGDGVLGRQPVILPGQDFRYASFCPLQSPYGNMRGRYRMWSKEKGLFWIRTPLFFFRPPERPERLSEFRLPK